MEGSVTMSYQFSDYIQKEEHDSFVKDHPLCNLLQSSSWGSVKENWDNKIVGVYDNGKLVASSLVLIKPLPLHFTMMYIPRGPILDYTNEQLVSFYFNSLNKWAKKYKCLFITFDPGIIIRDFTLDQQDVPYSESMQMIMDILAKNGAVHKGFTMNIKDTIQARFQANVYAKEDFMKSLPRHTQRLMKDATKRDVKVIRVGRDRIQDFADVVALTEQRKHVNLRNQDYFYRLMDTYGEDCYLFLAEVDIQSTLKRLYKEKEVNDKELIEIQDKKAPKKLRRLQDIEKSLAKDIHEFEQFSKEYPSKTVIAGVLSIRFGDTLEMLYAGMNSNFKKFMPQYYLYPSIMEYAFNEGCKFANMGGIEGDLQDGLTKFKSNFNPNINELIGEFDLPVNKLLYNLSQLAYKMRKAYFQKKK